LHLKYKLSLWGAGKGHDALYNANVALAWFPTIPPVTYSPKYVSFDQFVNPLVLWAALRCREHPYSSASMEAGDFFTLPLSAPWSWSWVLFFWLSRRYLGPSVSLPVRCAVHVGYRLLSPCELPSEVLMVGPIFYGLPLALGPPWTCGPQQMRAYRNHSRASECRPYLK